MDTAPAYTDQDTRETPAGGPQPSGSVPVEPRRSRTAPDTAPAQPTTLVQRTDTTTTGVPTRTDTTTTGASGRTNTTTGTPGRTDPITGAPVQTDITKARAGGPADPSAGMQVIGNTGPAKPYYQVILVRLPNNPEVSLFIEQAELTIQQSVHILGFGRSDPPPPPRNGKTPDKVEAMTLEGSGKGMELYKQQLTSAGTRQDSMVDMDAQVDDTSQMVAAEQAQTLFSIQHIVADLNAALRTVAPKKLKPAEEAAVMDHIAAAVTKVHDKVQAAQDVNVGAAGGDSGKGGSGGGGAAGGAGAGGGLGSILPMLAMLPMALMPMLEQLPEILGQKEDADKEGEDSEGEALAGEPAPQAGPVPTDPTVAAPEGTTAAPGGAPAQNPPPGTPQPEIPYGPPDPGKQV